MPVRNVPVSDVGPLARDVMLRSADTVPADMTVAEAQALLANPRLRMLLITAGDRYLGAIARERLAAESNGDMTLDGLADPDSSRVGPQDTVAAVLARLETTGSERLPVVDGDDRLLGLICFNSRKRHFCIDPAT